MIRFAVMVAFLVYTRRYKFISRAALPVTILCIGIIMHLDMLPGALAVSNSASGAARPLTGNGNANPRLPRTSASQLNSGNGATTSFKLATKSLNTTRNGNLRTREQQLLNIFEIIITTLEGKLKRIDNLDKTVELMMNHMDTLDNRVADNIGKSELIISKLHRLEAHLIHDVPEIQVARSDNDKEKQKPLNSSSNILENQLVQLDQKVTNIDIKLEVLKSQIDNNFLQAEDFNAEASEKKPISMNVIDITKALNPETMTHVSEELSELRDSTDSIDKKLQFHINIVSENIGRMIRMIHDIHYAVVDHHEQVNAFNITTTSPPPIKSSKIDALVKQIRPMVSVSEKMDEVWDVVVGTKSTVDHLLPKSDALLTQTQRQERAIDEIHQDLKTKTNLIINNLDMVEKRLKKQENDVQLLATRPGPTELLMDPTIDRLVEYDSSKYSIIEDNFTEVKTPLPPILSSIPISETTSPSPSQSQKTTSTGDVITSDVPILSTTTNTSNIIGGTLSASTASYSPVTTKSTIRKGGIIFPSVKNKPAVINNTFTNDILTLKDIRGFSCVDLLNAGMKNSGVFYLQIRGTTYWFLKVYCEQDISDGGWTVIQRRDDFGEPRENFNRDWADYKNGFGEPAKEFWLGNENIYMLTNNEEYTLRVELEDFEGNKRYAQYSHFKIHSEADYYKLEIDGYEGNAGDSLNDPWYGSNNSPFSTYNKDNDRSSLNCASMLKGGWWWKSCGRGLNGLYLHDPQDLTARQGIVWFRWRGWDYTLKKATMMIRPRAPQPQSMLVTSV
ncbi:angiopoietin-related protein 1 isoform X1 [Drosophila persimilis]|uniref:angiopoietin-related protein 1 isoform X1 n=1 Tax=Drosophila persimilis TaxID=7234 RepID=UPI000F076F05|nr:angiopoietin-related protein 1 isoform X1 [Drosophila persimilis]